MIKTSGTMKTSNTNSIVGHGITNLAFDRVIWVGNGGRVVNARIVFMFSGLVC